MSLDCWLIESEVLSLVPTTVNFDKHLSLMDTCHVVGTVYFRKYRPPLPFQTTASRCDFVQRDYCQCLSACRVGRPWCCEYSCWPHAAVGAGRQLSAACSNWHSTNLRFSLRAVTISDFAQRISLIIAFVWKSRGYDRFRQH